MIDTDVETGLFFPAQQKMFLAENRALILPTPGFQLIEEFPEAFKGMKVERPQPGVFALEMMERYPDKKATKKQKQ